MTAINRQESDRPVISVETVDGIAPNGGDVSVLSVTDRNMPFLYDSIMGEVTSTHRDILLADAPHSGSRGWQAG